MKVWITKYALTQGILEMEANQVGEEIIQTEDGESFYDGEWYKTKEEAQSIAKSMKEVEIKKLENKLRKLRNIRI